MDNTFFDVFNIEPSDQRLYERALTHRSYIVQHRLGKTSDQQERLEFFGDAVLKFVVSYFLMHKFPNTEEGTLTKIRSRIISDRSLSELAKKMNVGQFLLLSNSEEASGGRQRPSLLADTFEAILGALFLDKGAEYTQEWMTTVIETHLSNLLDVDVIIDYKTYLQEVVQKFGSILPRYECLNTTGPEHRKTFHYQVSVNVKGEIITSKGQGLNKKHAQQMAAQKCAQELKSRQLIDD